MDITTLTFRGADGLRLRYLAERIVPPNENPHRSRLTEPDQHEAALDLARLILDAHQANIERHRRENGPIYTISAGGDAGTFRAPDDVTLALSAPRSVEGARSTSA